MNIIFFGSTSDSVIVLEHLIRLQPTTYNLQLVAIVTQPPKPVGRKKVITPTPVETWAKSHEIPVLSFPSDPQKPWMYEHEQTVIDTLSPFKTDLIVSASYGQKIPSLLIKNAADGGLNVHPSILPRWRGADPVPWAIRSGDHQTGVTVVTLADKFDQGKIIAQKKIPVENTDTSDPLRTKLFELGAKLLEDSLPDYLSGKNKGHPQLESNNHQDYPYARKFSRDDGFVAWEKISDAMQNPSGAEIERLFRALIPWPGLWTNIRIMNHESGIMEEKRLKIVELHLDNSALVIDTVQLEGKKPVSYTQFVNAYHPSS
jgi:methionyl-tRNA formyltransferase